MTTWDDLPGDVLTIIGIHSNLLSRQCLAMTHRLASARLYIKDFDIIDCLPANWRRSLRKNKWVDFRKLIFRALCEIPDWLFSWQLITSGNTLLFHSQKRWCEISLNFNQEWTKVKFNTSVKASSFAGLYCI
jgi:hypothetical protein